MRHTRPGVDEISDGFSLQKIYATICYSPSCELSRKCLAGTGSDQGPQNESWDDCSSVNRDLEHILTGVAVRTLKEGDERLVEECVFGGVPNRGEMGHTWSMHIKAGNDATRHL
jgi:hypothetical protein